MFSVFVEERGGLHSGWLLRCCVAIDWFVALVRGILGLGGRYMIKFLEGVGDVVF